MARQMEQTPQAFFQAAFEPVGRVCAARHARGGLGLQGKWITRACVPHTPYMWVMACYAYFGNFMTYPNNEAKPFKLFGKDKLIHLTYPNRVIQIARTACFDSTKGAKGSQTLDPYNIDAGMNFLGKKGIVPNFEIYDRGAELICTWEGWVSKPLENLTPLNNIDVLYDYYGSDEYTDWFEPKYVLPNHSSCKNYPRLLLEEVRFVTSYCEESNYDEIPIDINEIFGWMSTLERHDVIPLIFQIKNPFQYIKLRNLSLSNKRWELKEYLNEKIKLKNILEKWASIKTKNLNQQLKNNPLQIYLKPNKG